VSIDFSNVVNALGTLNDFKSILNQAQSMATSYGSTVNQASKGAYAHDQVTDITQNGLDLTLMKIVDGAESQMIDDSNGILSRKYN